MKANLITVAYVFATDNGIITVRFKGCEEAGWRWNFEVEQMLRSTPLYGGKCNGAMNVKTATNLLRQALIDWKI